MNKKGDSNTMTRPCVAGRECESGRGLRGKKREGGEVCVRACLCVYVQEKGCPFSSIFTYIRRAEVGEERENLIDKGR